MLEKQYGPYKGYYVNYKRLKKMLSKGVKQKEVLQSPSTPILPPPQIASSARTVGDKNKNNGTFAYTLTTQETTSTKENYQHGKDDKDEIIYSDEYFRKTLDCEIEQVVLFFLQQQGDLATKLSQLSTQKHSLIDLDLDATQTLLTKYEIIADELLHLIHFVDLNVTAVRKILKKHDKIYTMNKISNEYLSRSIINVIQNSNKNSGGHYYDSHLNQLYHYGGISALVTSLKLAFYELSNHERFLMSQLNSLKSFTAMDGNDNSTSFASWSPVRTMKKTFGSTPSFDMYATIVPPNDSSSSHHYHVETILFRIDIARNHLYESKEYVNVLASQLMMLDGEDVDDDYFDAMMTESMREEQDIRKEAGRSTSQKISSWLNLISTFLYMTNYYIVAPTCGPYAEALGSSSALGGIIIGMTPLAALMASVLYAWWSNYSYKSALLFASCCCIFGDLLYALALHYKSLNMIIIGRYLVSDYVQNILLTVSPI